MNRQTPESVFDILSSVEPTLVAMASETQEWTYADLLGRVDRLAFSMLKNGLGKGDKVLVFSPPGPLGFVTLLACWRVGAIWCGLNPRLQVAELAHIVTDLNPKLMFVRTSIGGVSTVARLQEITSLLAQDAQLVALDDAADLPAAISLEEFQNGAGDVSATPHMIAETIRKSEDNIDPANDPAVIIYTSGTTGKSKGAVLSKYGLVRHALLQAKIWNLESIRSLNTYPLNHLSGIVTTLVPILHGGFVRCIEKFNPLDVPRLIENDRLTVWNGVPTMFSMILQKTDLSQIDLSSVKIIAWSGGQASVSLVQDLAKICDRLTTMYAMTESAGVISAVAPSVDTYALSETVGKPAEDCEVRLVDENGRPVQQGEPGEIQLRAPFLFLGYLTSGQGIDGARTDEDWFPTGDLGEFDDFGNLKLIGRTKDFFKSGGFNVYPKEVELVLDSHSAVRISAVVPASDEHFGEIGVAYIQAADNQDIDQDRLLEFCRERLANYKVPKRVQILPELPSLANGKIDKLGLREMAREIRD